MKNIFKHKDLLLSIAITMFVTTLTIGYAIFFKDLGIQGVVSLNKTGKVKITGVQLDTSASGNTLQNYGTMTVNEDGNVDLDYNFRVNKEEQTYKATYLIYVENSSPLDFTFTGIAMNPEVHVTSGNESNSGANVSFTVATSNKNHNINVGETIYAYETRCMAIVLTINVGSRGNANINVGGGGSATGTVDNTGDLTGTLVTNSVDLRGKDVIDCFDVEVINTYKYARNFELSSSNTNFSLVDSSDNSLTSFNIGAPSDTDPTANDKTYNVCIKQNEGAVFLTNSASTSIVLSSSGIEPSSVGNLNVTVDITEEDDEEIPHIGNVTMTPGTYDIANSVLPVHISFDRLDTGGSNILNYYIKLYDSDTGDLVGSYETGSSITNYTINMDSTFLNNNLDNMVTNNHSYYVKVYGEDEARNIGSSYCSLNDNNEYCVASNSTSLKWKFNVNTSGMNYMRITSGTTAYLNNTYTATISASSGYTLPSSINVTMTGVDNVDYTYSSANQTDHLVINTPVTGDISVSGSAQANSDWCLVEGTKIRLANGTTKNIEDVRYDDLILAYSYDLGRIVYEYPIWIEREGYAPGYQRTYFSNGEYIDTVGSHGIYSVDANKYVSVLDRDNFHIGTKVVSINDNNEREVVEVTNIETKNEEVKYYHVSSTRYHNVIANDLLTTDAILIVSNMFPFDENIMWTKERDEFLAKNDLFVYEDWDWLFPNHIFKGFRMAEGKILYYQGILDISQFSRILGGNIHPVPTSENGKNIWKITTSDEFENNLPSNWYEERTYYTLPEPIEKEGKEFVGWYNTADNKFYMPGDSIVIDYGMYFEAIWK